MNNQVHFDYKMIHPKYLRTDPSYQRDLSLPRVNQIVKNFDVNLFNEPKVSKRDDGFYYVFNGDHSIAAHKIKFGKDTPIRCKVYYGLTKEEEMRLFVQQNGISKTPTRKEKIRALANYEDPEVMGMINAAKLCGVEIEFKASQGVNKILAVDTAFSEYKSIGREMFINMLTVIKETWGGDPDSYQMGMLKGFGYIYKHCAEQLRGISNRDMIKALGKTPVRKIIQRAATFGEGMGKSYARAIIEQYNKGRRNRIIIQ
jgi:hypothetical protein